MEFHKEGYPTLFVAILFAAALHCIAYFVFPDSDLAFYFALILSLFFLVIVLQFFRSPVRKWNIKPGQIIAPADGKVVVIEETTEIEYFNDKRIQLSIFMSPLNVHVNRYPVSGTVNYVKYHPGKFLVAWDPKSSTDNERTTVVVEHEQGYQVLFRQIAGALARRIVLYSKQGEQANQTEEFGFIKFGSRVDVFLPLGTKILVKPNELVKGGITPLAEVTTI